MSNQEEEDIETGCVEYCETQQARCKECLKCRGCDCSCCIPFCDRIQDWQTGNWNCCPKHLECIRRTCGPTCEQKHRTSEKHFARAIAWIFCSAAGIGVWIIVIIFVAVFNIPSIKDKID